MSIARKIRKMYVRGFCRDRFQVVKRNRLNYLLNYKNYIDRKILIDGGYDKEQIAYFGALAKNNNCQFFYDIGANIGLYTTNISQVETIKKVFSFEPSIHNRYQLQANLLLNGLHEMVEVYPYALSDKKGQTTFLENLGNSTGRSRIKETNINELDPAKFEEKVVDVYRLDDLIEMNNQKLAIKIDVEGHEENVMKGMIELLTKNECILQVEVFQENIEKVERFLNEIGYNYLKSIKADRYYINA